MPDEGTQVTTTTTTPDVAAMQAELERFRASGLTPEQLEVVIPDYVELVNKSKAAPPPRPEPSPKESKPAPTNEKLRKEVLDLIPEIKEFSSVKEKLQAIESHVTEGAKDAFRDANLQAEEHITTYLTKELNVDADSPEGMKFIERVGELVADATYGREALLNRLAKGDSRVVKEVLKEFKEKGLFDLMKVPTKKEAKTLPYLSPRNNPFKETSAKIQEHLKNMPAHQRFRAIGSAVYDQVFSKRED